MSTILTVWRERESEQKQRKGGRRACPRRWSLRRALLSSYALQHVLLSAQPFRTSISIIAAARTQPASYYTPPRCPPPSPSILVNPSLILAYLQSVLFFNFYRGLIMLETLSGSNREVLHAGSEALDYLTGTSAMILPNPRRAKRCTTFRSPVIYVYKVSRAADVHTSSFDCLSSYISYEAAQPRPPRGARLFSFHRSRRFLDDIDLANL